MGDWRIEECRYLKPTGEWGRLVGQLHWRWILRGRALQDVWTLVEPTTHDLVYEGTTIRFYDPRREVWSSHWFSATYGRLRTFTGREEDGRIVLDEAREHGEASERWVFSEIEPRSFRWYAEQDAHDGRGWQRTEEMQLRRLGPALPLAPGNVVPASRAVRSRTRPARRGARRPQRVSRAGRSRDGRSSPPRR